MKRAPRSRQRHDLYAKYHDYDSEISDLLGECGSIGAVKNSTYASRPLSRKGCNFENDGVWWFCHCQPVFHLPW
ncbi:hypothetical protein ACFOMH_11585, partial [Paracoccus mangrovi]